MKRKMNTKVNKPYSLPKQQRRRFMLAVKTADSNMYEKMLKIHFDSIRLCREMLYVTAAQAILAKRFPGKVAILAEAFGVEEIVAILNGKLRTHDLVARKLSKVRNVLGWPVPAYSVVRVLVSAMRFVIQDARDKSLGTKRHKDTKLRVTCDHASNDCSLKVVMDPRACPHFYEHRRSKECKMSHCGEVVVRCVGDSKEEDEFDVRKEEQRR